MSNIFGGGNVYNDLTIQNNLTVGNEIVGGGNASIAGDLAVADTITATTVQATNGNFTNLTGTVAPGQLLVQHSESTNDNASLVVGNNLSTLTTNSRGVHVGYNSLAGQGSIYNINNFGANDELYLNLPFTGTPAGVHVNKLYANSITEQVPTNGVQLEGILFKTNLIEATSDSLTIDAGSTPNSNIFFQSLGTNIASVTSGGLTLQAPLLAGTNNLTTTSGSLNMGSGSVNINAGQTILAAGSETITGGILDTLHVSTASTGSNNWIGGSFGGPDLGNGTRVVMGNLGGLSTIGANSYVGGLYTAWADLYINPSANVHVGPDITFDTSQKLTVNGNASIQGNVNISGSFQINGNPVGAGASIISFSNYKLGLSSSLYTTVQIIPWGGINQMIPSIIRIAVQCYGVGQALKMRLTNYNQTITFFENTFLGFGVSNAIVQIFDGTVVTPINGTTLTTPFCLQLGMVAGTGTYDYYSGYIQ